MADEKASTDAASITGEAPEKAPVRPRNLYGYVRQAWKGPEKSFLREVTWARKIEWRASLAFVRLEHPTRIDRARELGFRAKPGYVVVRARVRRGGGGGPGPTGGPPPARRASLPRPHERGPQGTRPDVQGEGRGEGAPEHRRARPEGQVSHAFRMRFASVVSAASSRPMTGWNTGTSRVDFVAVVSSTREPRTTASDRDRRTRPWSWASGPQGRTLRRTAHRRRG